MARRPAEGSLTGVPVFRPELKLPLWPPPAHPLVRRLPQVRPRLVPIFYSSCSASELSLVRLKPGGDIKACKQEKPCK